jgi:hypothetical protein
MSRNRSSGWSSQAPITVQIQSPLELVQQLFVKLGARQLLVVDARGVYRGMVTKKSWLRFLDELDAEGHWESDERRATGDEWGTTNH